MGREVQVFAVRTRGDDAGNPEMHGVVERRAFRTPHENEERRAARKPIAKRRKKIARTVPHRGWCEDHANPILNATVRRNRDPPDRNEERVRPGYVVLAESRIAPKEILDPVHRGDRRRRRTAAKEARRVAVILLPLPGLVG